MQKELQSGDLKSDNHILAHPDFAIIYEKLSSLGLPPFL